LQSNNLGFATGSFCLNKKSKTDFDPKSHFTVGHVKNYNVVQKLAVEFRERIISVAKALQFN
tara:strand:- start:194 stop:379 length:186 start_codon:yes stop_codon:yes gene_type:complete